MKKIYIGKTYATKQGGLFTVEKIEKGNSKRKSINLIGRGERRVIDKDGNRLKVSNLLGIIS